MAARSAVPTSQSGPGSSGSNTAFNDKVCGDFCSFPLRDLTRFAGQADGSSPVEYGRREGYVKASHGGQEYVAEHDWM